MVRHRTVKDEQVRFNNSRHRPGQLLKVPQRTMDKRQGYNSLNMFCNHRICNPCRRGKLILVSRIRVGPPSTQMQRVHGPKSHQYTVAMLLRPRLPNTRHKGPSLLSSQPVVTRLRTILILCLKAPGS